MKKAPTKSNCRHCSDSKSLGFEITMAFQPIVNISDQSIFAYEALVRGANGEGAPSILKRVTEDNRYTFDQACRVKAIELASRLKLKQKLSINFLPNAIYNPQTCLQTTLNAAKEYQFPVERIIFEVSESEKVVDNSKLKDIITTYKNSGFTTAIDDFGSGYSGLSLFVDFQPNLLKIDRSLIENINANNTKQTVLLGVLKTCQALSIDIIAEGVETKDELEYLHSIGIDLIQGFYFAKPVIESLPTVEFE